ncbi:Uncharacterised protein [Mycobacteroides abscessus subsp. abscessus]|nr:Uncharacterised protein [Mycobacteroides abscessus subsp. abscessus]
MLVVAVAQVHDHRGAELVQPPQQVRELPGHRPRGGPSQAQLVGFDDAQQRER